MITRPIIRSIVRSVTSSLTGLVSEITTKMLAFDGATAYGELTEPWVGTDATATESIQFEATGTDYNLTNEIAVVSGALSMDAGITSALLDGVSIGITGAIPNDGKLHTLLVGGTFNTTHIAASNVPDNWLGSIVKVADFQDLNTPANSRTYTLDSGSDEYELPDAAPQVQCSLIQSGQQELFPYGDFSDAANFPTSSAQFEVAGGVATYTSGGTTGFLASAKGFPLIVDGQDYLVEFDISGAVGNALFKLGNVVYLFTYSNFANGHHSGTYTAVGTGDIERIWASKNGSDFSIGNLSIIRVEKDLLKGQTYSDSLADAPREIGAYAGEYYTEHDWQRLNYGVHGATLSTIKGYFEDSKPFPADVGVFILEGGVNTINSSSTDPNTAMRADMSSMVEDVLADSNIPIVINVMPFKGTANWTIERQGWADSFNAWIATTYPDYSVDAFTALEDPVNPDTLLPLYDSGDFLHHTSEGSREVDKLVAAVLNTTFITCGLQLALTYNNVAAGDWADYTYNAASADCSGGPGWEHDGGGDTVCIV